MAKERNFSVVPKTKGRKSTTGKNVNRTADDAAKKAQKTEQIYEEVRNLNEVTSFTAFSLNAKRQ
jgi:hypothetical protein